MAFEQFGPYLSEKAGADLSVTGQYRAVKYDATGNIVQCSVAGEKSLGILVDKPASGQNGTVQVYGVAKWEAGAAVARDAYLTTDAQGRAIGATEAALGVSPAIEGSQVMAKALRPAAAAGEIIPVLLIHAGLV